VAVGVAATLNDGTAFAVDDPARFKGGGMGEGLGLNEDRRFCADDLRRIVGRWEVDSPDKWAMAAVLTAQDDEMRKNERRGTWNWNKVGIGGLSLTKAGSRAPYHGRNLKTVGYRLPSWITLASQKNLSNFTTTSLPKIDKVSRFFMCVFSSLVIRDLIVPPSVIIRY
jgi:hypothetical protein